MHTLFSGESVQVDLSHFSVKMLAKEMFYGNEAPDPIKCTNLYTNRYAKQCTIYHSCPCNIHSTKEYGLKLV